MSPGRFFRKFFFKECSMKKTKLFAAGIILVLAIVFLAGCGEEGGYIVVKNTSGSDAIFAVVSDAEKELLSSKKGADIPAKQGLIGTIVLEVAQATATVEPVDGAHIKRIDKNGGTKTWMFTEDGVYWVVEGNLTELTLTRVELSGGGSKDVSVNTAFTLQ
jgi:hypothetical protein